MADIEYQMSKVPDEVITAVEVRALREAADRMTGNAGSHARQWLRAEADRIATESA